MTFEFRHVDKEIVFIADGTSRRDVFPDLRIIRYTVPVELFFCVMGEIEIFRLDKIQTNAVKGCIQSAFSMVDNIRSACGRYDIRVAQLVKALGKTDDKIVRCVVHEVTLYNPDYSQISYSYHDVNPGLKPWASVEKSLPGLHFSDYESCKDFSIIAAYFSARDLYYTKDICRKFV